MKVPRWKLTAVAAMTAAMLGVAAARPSKPMAQTTPKGIMMYEDVKTGAFYSKPGKGRVAVGWLTLGAGEPAAAPPTQAQVQQEVKQSNDELRAEFMHNQQVMLQKNAELTAQVSDMKPAWTDYMDNFKNKFRLGTLVYADWRFYSHTSYGPQELTQINEPGYGNNSYNTFDVTRTYLNFFFFPTDDWTVRVTPNLYRQIGAPAADTIGKGNTTYPSISDGNLTFRLKYAYLQYSKAFDRLGIEPMKGDTISIGQTPNPLVDWEEQLYGFRYVNLTPWNYLSLSSTQQGISIQGPVKFNGLQYIDYDAGVFNNASFHTFENTSTKQVMVRASVYPFGAKWRFDGLGLTGFYNYGYGNQTPDFVGSSPLFTAPAAHITRAAALLHYSTETWGLAGEWDYGHNAFTSGNLFSSDAPAGAWANNGTLATALLSNGRAVEQGFDFFGHVLIPSTPFTAFGMFQWFQPNTKVNLDPFDFQRWIAGVSYQYNEFLRFAIASQNLDYYHGQFNFSETEANTFAPEFKTPTTGKFVTNSVFRDVHALFLNAEFNF